MNILILTPQLPYPPHQGTTIRNYNLIRQLAQRHTVDLLTFLAPGEALTAENPLHTLCRRVGTVAQPLRSLGERGVATLTSRWPDMALRLESATMHKQVTNWLGDTAYDLVQVEGIELAQYGRQRTAGSGKQVKLIFDNHNCEYLLQKRNALADLQLPRRWLSAAYSLVQWQKLRWYEARVLQHADATIAVSPADAAALQALVPSAWVTVVSNGIDLAEYQPTTDSRATRAPPTLVFTGKMDYRPNIDAVLWFAHEVLPRIQRDVPAVRLQVVGMNPHARLAGLHSNPAIEITGAVDDTRPYIQQASVYVIPMRVGGGTRFKALEAMACARPIVSTTLGVEGIPVQQGRELLLADDPVAFAQAVVQVLHAEQTGKPLAQELGQRARHFVEQEYGWGQIIPRLEQLYVDVLARPGPSTEAKKG